MHEVGIMQEALKMAIETAASKQATRIHRLKLRIGRMSGVVPDALQFAFDMVCRGTMAEGAMLEVQNVPASCWCGSCQAEFVCEDFINECPRCHALSGDLRHGREMELAEVEVS